MVSGGPAFGLLGFIKANVLHFGLQDYEEFRCMKQAAALLLCFLAVYYTSPCLTQLTVVNTQTN
jgi:hypothetical protein